MLTNTPFNILLTTFAGVPLPCKHAARLSMPVSADAMDPRSQHAEILEVLVVPADAVHASDCWADVHRASVRHSLSPTLRSLTSYPLQWPRDRVQA